jgi:hypothetical protein
MSSITSFLQAFKGGTRVNRFLVKSSGVPSVGPNGDFETQIRAASFPALTVGTTPINFRGKTIQIPSHRVFNPWQILVMDDAPNPNGSQVGSLHSRFMKWSDLIVDTGQGLGVSRLHIANGGTESDPLSNCSWDVIHLDHANTNGQPWAQGDVDNPANNVDHNGLKGFRLRGCWPIQVGPIQLDMSVDNQLAFFQVTMAYTHIEDITIAPGGGIVIADTGTN